MASSDTFADLIRAAESAVLHGWDWHVLDGRYVETPPPWDYRAEVRARLPGTRTLLDMGTGGGELLSSLAPLPPDTWATEGYRPNLPVAEARLSPLGVRVVAVADDAQLPLPDAFFDLVINRHESFDAGEVRRILRPGGSFLTQQVGGHDNVELNAALQETITLSYPRWSVATARDQLRAAGLAIEDARAASRPAHFRDIGAVVLYLRFTPWQIADFSVPAYWERLHAVHHRMQAEGGLTSHSERFLVCARRPMLGEE